MNGKMIGSIVSLALILGVANVTWAGDAPDVEADAFRRPRCSEETLQGSYGYYGMGVVTPNAYGMPEGPSVSMGICEFDGKGKFTWTTSDLPGLHLTGTYEVKRDCTGVAWFHYDPFPPAAGNIVIVDGGKEVFIVPPADSPAKSVYVYKRQ